MKDPHTVTLAEMRAIVIECELARNPKRIRGNKKLLYCYDQEARRMCYIIRGWPSGDAADLCFDTIEEAVEEYNKL